MANTIKLDREIRNKALRGLLDVRTEIGADGSKEKEKFQTTLEKLVAELVERAQLLVPVETAAEPVKDKDGGLCIPASSSVTFVILSNDQKQKFIPIFSDWETYSNWEKADNVHAMTMDFTSLGNLLETTALEEGLVLNPFTDNFLIRRDVALRWYRQFTASHGGGSRAIPASMAEKAYNLNPYPLRLMNTLCEAARNTPAVKSLWLRGINFNNEDSYLLIVDFDGDRQKAVSPLGEAARKFLGDKPLHIVPLDEGFGGRAAKGVAPIYTRER